MIDWYKLHNHCIEAFYVQLTLRIKSTNIDKVALHIHHMMTLTNFIHFQRSRKNPYFWSGKTFYWWSTLPNICQHTIICTVLSDVWTVFKLPVQFFILLQERRIKRARKMSSSLCCSIKRGDCISAFTVNLQTVKW